MDMKIISIGLTDGSGDSGYAVDLNVDAANWEDKSSQGHQIATMTQGGNVQSRSGGLACEDAPGQAVLMLKGASWGMTGGSGSADHQSDPTNPVEHDWTWEFKGVSTR
jgi:hypothetical protein